MSRSDDLGVVHHADARALGRGVVAVHQRLAAAEEERVGAPQVQRAAQRRLEPDAELPHPRRALRRPVDEQPRERPVGLVAGDANQIGEELVFGYDSVRTSVGAACAQRRLRVCRLLPPRKSRGALRGR